MQLIADTPRLSIRPLSQHDQAFILDLVNTEGWLRFIGNRHIYSLAEASTYIQGILESTDTLYGVVELKAEGVPIGIVTLLQRSYLEHRDIGFAFLPAYSGKGYAYEAASATLRYVVQTFGLDTLLATALPYNRPSIKLLTRLGFSFQKAIQVNETGLHVYIKK
jgi:RimJ/RimL family protein N-acetyltransferase